MTKTEAAAKLAALTGDDPERDHGAADQILLELAGPTVEAAYDALVARCRWWSYA